MSRRSNISARTVTVSIWNKQRNFQKSKTKGYWGAQRKLYLQKSSKSSETESSTGSRKRKTPGSVIGSIIKRDDEEEDEEYDPHKPQYGRVASTVKVGLRRQVFVIQNLPLTIAV